MKREQRIETNDYRARVFGRDASRLIGFVCECGDPDCRRTVALTLEEYNESRPGFLLHDAHGDREGLRRTG